MWVNTFCLWLSLPVSRSPLGNTPPVNATLSERVVGAVILPWPPGFLEKRSWQRDVTAMMALQLKNGDAAYYQSAEYCRNYTSPPVSYGDSSHYLARLPGKERLAIQDLPPLWLSAVFCANVQGWRKSNQRHLQMVQGKVDVEAGCPGAAVIIIMSCRGVHQPSVYGCCDAKSEVVEILALYCRKSSRFGLMSNCNFKQFRASVQCPLSSIK